MAKRLVELVRPVTLGDLVKNVTDDEGHEHGADGKFVGDGESSGSEAAEKPKRGKAAPKETTVIKVRDKAGHNHGNDGRFSAGGGSKKDEVIRPEGWKAANDTVGTWNKPGHIYRGMTEDEYKAHHKAGYIQSTGAYSHESEGTNFADSAEEAESYANYGRDDPRETGKPTYLVEMEHDDELTPKAKDGYHKATGKIPLTAVTRAWKMESKDGAVVANEIDTYKHAEAAHAAAVPLAAQQKSDLQELFGEAAYVKSRAKDPGSMYEKVAAQPGDRIDDLWDRVGSRVIVEGLTDVEHGVQKIRAKYGTAIKREKDYNEHPKDGYRSHHFNVEMPDGTMSEIQVATKNQRKWADWAHKNVYKPKPDKKELAAKHVKELTDYANAASDHFHAKDLGKGGTRLPDCTEVIRNATSTGCLTDD